MLPINSFPEPANFEVKVRQPGMLFLSTHAVRPIKQEFWRGKDYWREVLDDMSTLYDSICSYCSTWIKHSTGVHSIDHFLSKNKHPDLAYEWSNYRYSSMRFNSRKSSNIIADPFKVGINWFIIDFSTQIIKPNPDKQVLTDAQRKLVSDTIETLKLNDDKKLMDERVFYYDQYIKRQITFSYLKRVAPFIAYEIDRQGLIIP